MKNETLEVIKNRTSLRVFDNRPVSEEEERWIIESALLAPSAGTQMLYSMIVIKESSRKEKIAEICDHSPFLAKAPLMIVFVADCHKWDSYFKQNGVEAFAQANGITYHEPQESDLIVAIEDTMTAAQSSVIAAESMGIGSCYTADIVEHAETVKTFLNLPTSTFPVCVLVYGHPRANHKKVHQKRFDRKFVVFEERYPDINREDLKAMFQERELSFNPENPWNAKNYAQEFYARKPGAFFCQDMARSVQVWLEQWRK